MSQFGMQLPGSQARRTPALNVYTALMFVAVVCLAAGVVMVWQAATKVSPESGPTAPFSMQQAGQIKIAGGR